MQSLVSHVIRAAGLRSCSQDPGVVMRLLRLACHAARCTAQPSQSRENASLPLQGLKEREATRRYPTANGPFNPTSEEYRVQAWFVEERS